MAAAPRASARHLLSWLGVALAAVTAVALVDVWLHHVPGVDGSPPADRHAWAVRALLLVAAAAAVATAVDRRTWTAFPAPVAAAVALVAGRFLAWDQLALRSVTVGTDLRGTRAVLDDEVRFVLVDGVELSPAAVGWWAAAHVAALVVAAAVLAWTALR